jgi:small conductance mechanosensitive channel
MRLRPKRVNPLFESRTEQWRQVGLGGEIDRGEASRARGGMLVFGVLIAGVVLLFAHRRTLFPGLGTPVRISTVVALIILGWGMARSLGRGLAPALFRRMDPATAGTAGFVIRLVTVIVSAIAALRIAGLDTGTLAVGGAFTAVVLGLASQQALGNIFAGLVLLSTRPFRAGERVRLRGGPMAGNVEGIVSSLGLYYTTLVDGADRVLVPNSVLLQLAVIPLREPERVDLRARFNAHVTPVDVQERLAEELSVPTSHPPHIALEEVDRDEVVVRIVAAPLNPRDGAALAAQVQSATRGLAGVTERDGAPAGA